MLSEPSNMIYIAVVTIGGVIVALKKGVPYFLNYASILVCLFLPIFITIDTYKIVRQLTSRQPVSRREVYLILAYAFVVVLAFSFGLKDSQADVLAVIDSILCVVILLVMLFISYKNRNLN